MAAFKQNENYMVMFPFNKDQKIQARLVGITELGRYAYKTSAYPNYQMGEAVYELKFVPVNTSEAAALFINSSVFVSGMLAK